MATYVYETIPSKPGEKIIRYEIWQSMKDDPLTVHPHTGKPIRRIVIGGIGGPGSITNPGPDPDEGSDQEARAGQ